MNSKKVIVFGTSRIHRPFAKMLNRELVTNTHPDYEIVFPRVGYFHTAAEISQAIRFFQDPELLPKELRQYIFRIEPRATTPLNEFDTELENSIKSKSTYAPPAVLNNIESVILEISSLTVNRHIKTGVILHTNPNIFRNIPYNQIYPEGYYNKFRPELHVEKVDTTLDQVITHLSEIKNHQPLKGVIVLSHLRSPKYPNTQRERIHVMAAEACSRTGCTYVDTADILDTYGFSENAGVKDIHHLSHEGENALSQRLFATLNSLSRFQ